MSSPGGREIGRVSIRVVPATDGFRRELQRDLDAIENSVELTVPVGFDVDTAGLRAQLESIHAEVTIPANIDLDTAGLHTQLAALDRSRVTIPVELDADIGALQAQLSAIDGQRIRLNVETTGIAEAVADLRLIDSLVDRLDGRNVRIHLDVDGLAFALAQLTAIGAALAALQGARGAAGGAGGFLGIGGLAGGIGTAVGLTVQLGKALATASVYATALTVAGAGISAVFGAASTAVAALPAVLALAAAPMGTVLAGMDGIKKAAESIKPQFDALQKSVSATFEKGMLPVFKQLATTFPTLQTGMDKVANSLVGIAGRLTEMVASGPGLDRLNAIFNNVSSALDRMSPGIAAVTDSILILGSQSKAFDPLITAVNEFGTRFRANVLDLIGDGTLDRAFQGLADMTGIAARGFADLVHNGIELFANAAPGVNQFLESLTGFFNRFDWGSLGTSIGGVFSGLAEALDRVPQSTIDGIEASFARLSQTFQSADFQNQITTMINGIPSAIDLINQLVVAFGYVGSAVSIAIQAFQRIGSAVSGFANIMHGAALTILQFGRIIGNPVQAWLDRADIGAQFDRAGGLVREGVDKVGHAFTDPWPAFGAAGAAAAASATGQIPEAVLAPLRGIPGAINTLNPQIASVVSNLGGQSANAAERAMQGVPPAVVSPLQPIPGQVAGALAPAEQAAQTATTNIGNVLQAGAAKWGPQVDAGLAGISTSFQIGAAQWSTTVGTAITGVSAAITTGLAGSTAAATAGMTGVTTAIATGTANWYVAVSQGMTVLQTAVQLGFTNLTTTATTGMTNVQTAITTGVTNWATAITTGFTGMTTVMAAGFQLMGAIATAGMNVVAAGITAGFAAVNAAITAGMAAAVAGVTAGMAAVQAAFVVNWAAVTAATTAAMAQMAAVVQTGTQQIVTTVQTGWQQITAAAQQGTQQMVSTLTNGMNQSVSVVTSGISRMVSALNSAVGQFRAAGANMGQALADGLNSKAGVVEAAARRLANAAAAAVRAAAAIHSPSRVFTQLGEYMGEGLEVGLRDARNGIIAEAVAIVDGLETEFRRAEQIGIDPTAGFDAARLEANLRHSYADSEVTPAADRTPVQITTNVYNPQAETGSDSVAKVNRRQAAMGMFG